MDGDAYAVIILSEEGIACKLSVFAEECAVNFVVFCVPRLDAAEDFFSVDAGLDALIGFVCLDKYGVDLFAEICWVELADEKISVALSDLVSSIVAQVPDSMVMNGCKVWEFVRVSCWHGGMIAVPPAVDGYFGARRTAAELMRLVRADEVLLFNL